jgi:hypothetical protein
MDILNFISWIKAGNYREVLPTNTNNLLAIGTTDPLRDDGYLSLAVNAAPLQALYDTANVTQITAISTAVTVNANNGIITTVSSTLGAGSNAAFTVNNSKVLATSRILLTAEHPGAGIPILITETIVNGSFDIRIYNLGSSAFNNVINISYIIIN